jgi:hypothetical protein
MFVDVLIQQLIYGLGIAARIGHATKGLVYVCSGLFSLMAVGSWRDPTSSRSALGRIAVQPFGRILIAMIAIGLLLYGIWCGLEAYKGYRGFSKRPGLNLKKILKAGVHLCKALIYGYLSFEALELAFDVSSAGLAGDDDAFQETLAGIILSYPIGIVAIYILGFLMVAVGAYQGYLGLNAGFRKRLRLGEMNSLEVWGFTWVGRLGTMARGVVFIHIGYLLTVAAYTLNPDKVATSDGALKQLEQQLPPWLFSALALGLIAYGLYALVLARYRKVDMPQLNIR